MFCVLVAAVLSWPTPTYVDKPETIRIPTDQTEVYYIIRESGAGAILNLREGPKHLKFEGEKANVDFILQFDDDDYWGGAVDLTFSKVDVTFDCYDAIKFTVSHLEATESTFTGTKTMAITYSGNLDSSFDLASLASGFGPDGVFATYMVADHRPKIVTEVDGQVHNVKFLASGFVVGFGSGEEFAVGNPEDVDLVLSFPKGAVIDGKVGDGLKQVSGGFIMYGEELRIVFAAAWEAVTKVDKNVTIWAELVEIPWTELPSDMFRFVDEYYDDKPDQVILYKGEERYCLYDEGSVECDVFGTIPHVLLKGGTVEVISGTKISFFLCTTDPVPFKYVSTSSTSVYFYGTTQKKMSLTIDSDASVKGTIHFEGLEEVSLGEGATSYACAAFEIVDSTLKYSSLSISTSLFSSPQTFFKDEVVEGQVKLTIAKGGCLTLTGMSAFDDIEMSGDSLSFYQNGGATLHIFNDFKDVYVKLIVDDPSCTIRPTDGVTTVRGGLAVYTSASKGTGHVLLDQDWTKVIKSTLEPAMQFESVRKGYVLQHFLDTPLNPMLVIHGQNVTAYSMLDAHVCLYYEGREPCTPQDGGFADVIKSDEYYVQPGIKYVYWLPEDFDEDTKIIITGDSASKIGLVGSEESQHHVTLMVPESSHLTELYLVNLRVEFDAASTQVVSLTTYENLDAEVDMGSRSLRVSDTLILSWQQATRFASGVSNVGFTGQTMVIRGREGAPGSTNIDMIQFKEDGWEIGKVDGLTYTFNKTTTFHVESYAESVTLSVDATASWEVPALTFVGKADCTVTFDRSFAMTSTSRLKVPNTISSSEVDVTLLHPFPAVGTESDVVFTTTGKVAVYSYTNCSICLSKAGTESCGLEDPYFIKAAHPTDGYVVPQGYRLMVHTDMVDAKISFDSESMTDDFEFGLFGNSDRHDITVVLPEMGRHFASMKWTIEKLNIILDGSSEIAWQAAEMVLHDVKFTSSSKCSLTVTKNSVFDMDVFNDMTGGLFKGAFKTAGLYLQDSDDEYLEKIKFTATGCVLTVSSPGGDIEIPLVGDGELFTTLMLGVNTPWESTVPRIIPMTVESGVTTVNGAVTVSIDEVSTYLYAGKEWLDVKVSTKIAVRDTHTGADKGRVIHHHDIDLSNYFSLDSGIGVVDETTSGICLYDSNSFSLCYAREEDLLPRLCENNICLINESRMFYATGSATGISYKFSENIHPYMLYGSDTRVDMDSIPDSVNLSVASMTHFGEGTIDVYLDFTKSERTLAGLSILNPIMMGKWPTDLHLTLQTLSMDFQSFKRLFRDNGIFAEQDSITVTERIRLREEARYSSICFTPDGWQLIGNEDAWNTTLRLLGSATLQFDTTATTFTLSADDTQIRESVIMVMKTKGAQIIADPSFIGLSVHNNEIIELHAESSAVFSHGYRDIPSYIQLGTGVNGKYTPLANIAKYCLWARSEDDCKNPDYIKRNDMMTVPAAGELYLELQSESHLIFTNNGAMNVHVEGNGYTLSVDMGSVTKEIMQADCDIQLVNAPLFIVPGTVNDFYLHSLTTDVVSLSQTEQVTIRIAAALSVTEINGPKSDQAGKPTFVLDNNALLWWKNAFLNDVVIESSTSVSFRNSGNVKWQIDNIQKDNTVTFHTDPVTLASANNAAGASFKMVLDSDTPHLNVTTAITGSAPTVSTNGRDLSLVLASAANVAFTDDVSMHVDLDTLSRMQFSYITGARITVLSAVSMKKLVVGANRQLRVGDNIATIPCSTFTGQLTFLYSVAEQTLILDIDSGVSSVPSNIVIQLLMNTKIEVENKFTNVHSSAEKIRITGSGSMVMKSGYLPPCFIVDSGIAITFDGDGGGGDEGDSGGLSGGAIAGIVIAVIAAIAGGVVGFILIYNKRQRDLMYKYDSAPDAPVNYLLQI